MAIGRATALIARSCESSALTLYSGHMHGHGSFGPALAWLACLLGGGLGAVAAARPRVLVQLLSQNLGLPGAASRQPTGVRDTLDNAEKNGEPMKIHSHRPSGKEMFLAACFGSFDK